MDNGEVLNHIQIVDYQQIMDKIKGKHFDPAVNSELWAICSRYHKECEVFENEIFTGITLGQPRPSSVHQRIQAHNNAIERKKKLFERGDKLGYTRDEVQKALEGFRP